MKTSAKDWSEINAKHPKMNRNWAIVNGVLYRQSHNHDSLGYAVASVKHLAAEQIEEIIKAVNLEKTIKEKIAKVKELIDNHQITLIKRSALMLGKLAEMTGVSPDTMKSYSAGRLNMPEEIKEKIRNITALLSGTVDKIQ